MFIKSMDDVVVNNTLVAFIGVAKGVSIRWNVRQDSITAKTRTRRLQRASSVRYYGVVYSSCSKTKLIRFKNNAKKCIKARTFGT